MSGREDVLRGLGEVAPDWRIEDDDCRRLKVRNRDGYLADVRVNTNPETSRRNRNAVKLIARAPALVEEVRRLREAVRMARDEMAALVPKPRAVDLGDWPCENEADRECLQSAWGELNRVLPHTQEADDGE